MQKVKENRHTTKLVVGGGIAHISVGRYRGTTVRYLAHNRWYRPTLAHMLAAAGNGTTAAAETTQKCLLATSHKKPDMTGDDDRK